MSRTGAGNLCDVAPSRFERFNRDEYFTIDAGWIIPALCYAVQVEGPILEPCAGRGHMVRELRALGFVVRGADLYAYANLLVPDIKTGVDVFELKSLAVYRFFVTNLRTGRDPRASPADRGPRWSPSGGSGALRVEFGRVPPRAHSRECAVRWRSAAHEAARVGSAGDRLAAPLVQLVRLVVGAAPGWPRPLSALRWPCVGKMRRVTAGVTHLMCAEHGGES